MKTDYYYDTYIKLMKEIDTVRQTLKKKFGYDLGKEKTFDTDDQLLKYYKKLLNLRDTDPFVRDFKNFSRERVRQLTPTYPDNVVLSPLGKKVIGANTDLKTGSPLTRGELQLCKQVRDIIRNTYGEYGPISNYTEKEMVRSFQGENLITQLGRCQNGTYDQGNKDGKDRFDKYGEDLEFKPNLEPAQVNNAVTRMLNALGHLPISMYSEPVFMSTDTFKKVSGVGEPYNISSKSIIQSEVYGKVTAKEACFKISKEGIRDRLVTGEYSPANLGVIPSPGAKGVSQKEIPDGNYELPIQYKNVPRIIFMAGRATTNIGARLARPIIDKISNTDMSYIRYWLAYYDSQVRPAKLGSGKNEVEKATNHRHWVNIDFSRGDQTNRVGLITLSFTALFYVMKDKDHGNSLGKNFLLTIFQPVIGKENGKFKLKGRFGTVSSGIIGTQLIGSLDNIGANSLILDEMFPSYIKVLQNKNIPYVQVLGDDIVVAMQQPSDLELYSRVAKKYGLNVSPIKSQHGFMFLQQYVLNEYDYIYPLARVARSLVYRRFSTGIGPHQWLLSQMAIFSNAFKTPGIKELFRYFKQYDKLKFGEIYNYDAKIFLSKLKEELNEVRSKKKKDEKLSDAEILNFDNPNFSIFFNKQGDLKADYISTAFSYFKMWSK